MKDLFLQSGVDLQTIIPLLMLPLIVTLIAFARHVIGFKTVGIYILMVLILVFYKLGISDPTGTSDPVRGIQYGLFLFMIVLVTTTAVYAIIKRWSLHYYPKLAILITSVCLALIVTILLAGEFQLNGLLKVDVFTLALIATVAEGYMNMLARKSFKTTVMVTFESLVLVLVCYLLITWKELQDLLLNYPFVILLVLPIDYLIGKYTGLRLREYFRFRSILDSDQ